LKYIGEHTELISLEINMVMWKIFYYVFFRNWWSVWSKKI